ncbi:hypothetical protein LWI29_011208 [Acer saccharum]|uniref:Uncharacterized protein n=1 Tax=Acer saccharum TaxID=4024 RepID=A0AA39RWW8_ACESA|nr:hypothetical protein LWI29_011208 [Acer saccharum]
MEVAQFSTVASRNFLATSHSISTNRSLCNSRRLAGKSTKFVSSWTGSSTASKKSSESRNVWAINEWPRISLKQARGRRGFDQGEHRGTHERH